MRPADEAVAAASRSAGSMMLGDAGGLFPALPAADAGGGEELEEALEEVLLRAATRRASAQARLVVGFGRGEDEAFAWNWMHRLRTLNIDAWIVVALDAPLFSGCAASGVPCVLAGSRRQLRRRLGGGGGGRGDGGGRGEAEAAAAARARRQRRPRRAAPRRLGVGVVRGLLKAGLTSSPARSTPCRCRSRAPVLGAFGKDLLVSRVA